LQKSKNREKLGVPVAVPQSSMEWKARWGNSHVGMKRLHRRHRRGETAS